MGKNHSLTGRFPRFLEQDREPWTDAERVSATRTSVGLRAGQNRMRGLGSIYRKVIEEHRPAATGSRERIPRRASILEALLTGADLLGSLFFLGARPFDQAIGDGDPIDGSWRQL